MTSGVTGVGGVVIWTSEERWPAMAVFYQETLGMTPRTLRPGFVNFAWGHTRLTVTVHDGVDGMSSDPLRIMVNLLVDDIHATHHQLAHDRNVTFLRSPENEPWGGWIATFHDPDGNTLQLLQPATP